MTTEPYTPSNLNADGTVGAVDVPTGHHPDGAPAHHETPQATAPEPAAQTQPATSPESDVALPVSAPSPTSSPQDKKEPLSITPFLHALVQMAGSDLHCKVGSPPRLRINGKLRKLQVRDLTPEDTASQLRELLTPEQVDEFERHNEADFAHSLSGVGRFRVNAFRSRGSVGLVFRRVSVGAQPFHELHLPEVVANLAMEPRGLVLVTGPTGSGKTTTLAAMVDLINTNREVHIITIEDPIEVLHHDKLAMINQREVRHDTADFGTALRGAMRQDPDVILVGEMRDHETVKAGLTAAETGHLVMSTLHTTDAHETITRVIDFFPSHEQKQVRQSLAASLKGILCQRLVPTSDGKGRAVVMEVCVNTGRIADAIADSEKTAMIPELVEDGSFYGMQSFDQHLVSLVGAGRVTLDDAMHASSNPHNLTVELRRQGIIE